MRETLLHGYTNHTVAVGPDRVRKSYVGGDALVRQATESLCLTRFPKPSSAVVDQ